MAGKRLANEQEPSPVASTSTVQSDNKEAGNENGRSSMRSSISLRQWLQVLSSSMVFLNTWGLVLAWGSLQSYYSQHLLPEYSSSQISWISTTSGFLLVFCSLVTGPLFDRGWLCPLLIGGSLLEVFGLVMLSLSTKYYQIFLSQGICIGLGCTMLYIPSIAAAALTFDNPATRARMMGLIASATGIGGVIYPIMFDRLIPQIGFAWTCRAVALVVFVTYLFAYPTLFFPVRQPPSVRRMFDRSALSDVPFMCIAAAGFLCGLAYFIPMLYIPLFAQTESTIHMSSSMAIYLVAIFNGASFPGRLLGGFVAARIGPLETYVVALAGTSIIIFCWIAVESAAGIIVWAAFCGFTSSGIWAMPGAFLPLLSPSPSIIGTRSGMFWAATGVGVLIGSPVGGTLLNPVEGVIAWWQVQLFSAVLMLASAGFATVSMIAVRRRPSKRP